MPQLTPRGFDSVCGMAWISGFLRCSLGDSVGADEVDDQLCLWETKPGMNRFTKVPS